jgi:hypothetical protein
LSELDFTGVEKASWELLKPHNERGALFVAAENLELSLVARALSRDDTEMVKNWLSTKALRSLTPEEEEQLDKSLDSAEVEFIIVQPYVIIHLNSPRSTH